MKTLDCTLTCHPSRELRSKEAVRLSLQANQDFIYNHLGNRWDGKAVDASSLIRVEGPCRVHVRFNALRSSAYFLLTLDDEDRIQVSLDRK